MTAGHTDVRFKVVEINRRSIAVHAVIQQYRSHIQPNGQFWTIFGQNGKNGTFFKKALGTFFSHLQALTVKFQNMSYLYNGFSNDDRQTTVIGLQL